MITVLTSKVHTFLKQVVLIMISALILSSRHINISVLGVVVRGAKKHYVNVKTEQTLSTLQPTN